MPPSPPDASLHLRRRSGEGRCVWRVGAHADATTPAAAPRRELHLAVRPDRHESFASTDAILAQLEPYAGPAERELLALVDRYLAEACPERLGGGAESRGRFLTDSVTFAIMRRVSRESFYTARVIDLGARALNGILARLPFATVHVEHADRLDRPTLKLLARAMLLLEDGHGFSWVWHLDGDPLTASHRMDDLFASSRSALLRQVLGIVSPVVVRNGAPPLARPGSEETGATLDTLAAELVMQNYDRCFLLAAPLLRSSDDDVGEVLRLKGLAEVNIGRIEEALQSLREAEAGAGPGRRAHLAYLQGLIRGKRRYDLDASSAEYRRGLRLLRSAEDAESDVPLEQGWLLNGLALNEAILWRREPGALERHSKAFALEQEAFDLVREGSSAPRVYLRFNLVANSALLMEMRGEYDVAIDIFRKTFDFDFEFDGDETRRSRWESNMGYRIGVLEYRAGRLDSAYRLLHHAAEESEGIASWPTRERILRALGAVALERGGSDEAAAIFRDGLETCRAARAAEGARDHGRGLVSSLVAAGRRQDAEEVLAELREDECLTFERPDDVRTRPPSPKLPAYFPELDLEGIPEIDLNRFLGIAPTGPASERTPWRG